MAANFNPDSKVNDLTFTELKKLIYDIVEDIFESKNDKDIPLENNYLNTVKEAIENYKSDKRETKEIIYWQQDDMWLGYLAEYPDYMTQGKSFEELEENLLDIYKDLSGNLIPNVRKVGHLKVA
jgi:predicted RNase H-like HicB family nuclease